MNESVLNGKMILAVDDEPDVLVVLEEEIMEAAPKSRIDKATSYEQAIQLFASWTYDLVILDIMGVRGFDLLKRAVDRPYHFPVVILTSHSLSPESLKQSIELGARAFLPKDILGEIVPHLEAVVKYEYGTAWSRLFKQLEGFFNTRWGPYWQKLDQKFWKEFKEKISPKG